MSKGRKKAAGAPRQVETLTHKEARRKNIPTAELQSAAQRAEEIAPFAPVVYPRRYPLAHSETRPRDPDLDPQLVWKGTRVCLTAEQIKRAAESGYIDLSDAQLTWRGKDQQDWSDLVVNAPPLYIQEKIHPKAIIDDLTRRTKAKREAESDIADLFHDFNGIDPEAKTEFYAHDQNWSNRFILGDSLQVMASLAEREGLRGQVQCIYFDPPYGIKFNSNWQVSTQSKTVTDGRADQITREPEQVRAFRDTWKDGVHSYLTYLRDRLTAMRDLLTESGSIFVQIGDENVHRVRALLDEIFGDSNFILEIVFKKTAGLSKEEVSGVTDYILWYAKNEHQRKLRRLFDLKSDLGDDAYAHVRMPNLQTRRMTKSEREGLEKLPAGSAIFREQIALAAGLTRSCVFEINFEGLKLWPKDGASWKSNQSGMARLKSAGRLKGSGNGLSYIRYINDFPVNPINNFFG